MDINHLQEKKEALEKQVQEYRQKLNQLIAEQSKITGVEELAESVLRYTDLENEISDRGLILSLLSQDLAHFKSPFFKAQFGSYLDAAETCGSELVDFITDLFHEAIMADFPEYKSADEFHVEYRQHILPGKILSGRFDQLDALVREMDENIKKADPQYNENLSPQQLYEAFKVAIGMNINLEGIKKALEAGQIAFLTEEARKDLLELVKEKEKAREWQVAKDQNVAMERAVKMLEQKEVEKQE